MHVHGFVWVCNLGSAVETWSVHLAGVQRAAHRIMVTVAVASVFFGTSEKNQKTLRERGNGGK